MNQTNCPGCGFGDLTQFLEMKNIPVYCNVLWDSEEEARKAQTGGIKLAYCRNCDLIFNMTFDENLLDYNPDYENSLHFSSRFQEYAVSLAKRLIDTYDLHKKSIIEIGAGQGDFLKIICKMGKNMGIGFDPASSPEFSEKTTEFSVEFIQKYFSDAKIIHHVDMIIARHTLEHIPHPVDFLKKINKSITNSSTKLFLEVPNMIYILKNNMYWDVIYEHCLYFVPSALNKILKRTDFKVIEMKEEFGSQFLTIISQKKSADLFNTLPQNPVKTDYIGEIITFSENFQSTLEYWKNQVEQYNSSGKKAVVWGAGSKGITFLNLIDNRQTIKYIVDINPGKHGKYVAGTAQGVVDSVFLKQYKPDVVLIMNSIYKDEIVEICRDSGIKPEIICI